MGPPIHHSTIFDNFFDFARSANGSGGQSPNPTDSLFVGLGMRRNGDRQRLGMVQGFATRPGLVRECPGLGPLSLPMAQMSPATTPLPGAVASPSGNDARLDALVRRGRGVLLVPPLEK